MLLLETAAMKAKLLAGDPTLGRAGRHAALVQSTLPLLTLAHAFNHGVPSVSSLCGGIKVDWAKGAAMAAAAYDLAKPFDTVKGTLKRRRVSRHAARPNPNPTRHRTFSGGEPGCPRSVLHSARSRAPRCEHAPGHRRDGRAAHETAHPVLCAPQRLRRAHGQARQRKGRS